MTPQKPVVTELEQTRPQALIEAQKKAVPPGPPPFVEALAPVQESLEEPGRLYTLDFDQAQLSVALRSILRGTDLGLSVESEVDLGRTVTVHARNATLEELLDQVVVKGAGYAWAIEQGRLEVNRFEEAIYHLDYLDTPGATDVHVGGDMLASTVGSSSVSGKFEIKTQRTAKESDVWAQVKEVLEGLKSAEGILQVNRNSGVIYMADSPAKVATMVRFLDRLKESLHRQVFIEAKIVDVQLNDANRYGIDWEGINIAVNPNNFGSVPDRASFNFNRSGAITLNEFTTLQAVIDFLASQGDVQILSNPHISVLNGQSAVLTVGRQFPFSDITGISRDEDTDVVTIDATIKRVVFGLQLGITPQISSEGVITLNIVPTITRLEGTEEIEVPVSLIGTQTFENPVIGLQELATTVRVREGQGIVLAGLISQEKNLNTAGLPFLSKIPFFGYLFGNAQEEINTRELVILIKPYIKEVS